MTTLYQYLVWCDNEAIFIQTDYMSSVPTTCPHNNTHTIDPTKTSVTGEFATNSVIALVNKDGTGANWKNKVYDFTFPPGGSTLQAPSLLYDIRLSEIKVLTRAENIGDIFSVRSPIINIGYLTVAGNLGDTTLNVNPEVFNYLYNGYHLYIDDGLDRTKIKFPSPDQAQILEYSNIAPSTDSKSKGKIKPNTGKLPGVKFLLEECYDLDNINNTVKVEIPLDKNYPIGSVISMEIEYIEDIPINNSNNILSGGLQGETLLLKKGTSFYVHYQNNAGINHTIDFSLQYYY